MDCLQCNITFPLLPGKCDRIVLTGGIKGFVLAQCNIAFNDILDLDEWCSKKNDGSIISSAMRRITGNEPEAEEAVAKLGSCDADELLNLNHTVEILDYNSEDPAISAAQDVFYNYLNSNYQKMSVGFIACDDRFIGFVKAFSVTCKRITDPNSFDGTTHWHIIFKYEQKNHVIPVLITGIGDTLENCPAPPPPVINAFRSYNNAGTQVYAQVTALTLGNDETYAQWINVSSGTGVAQILVQADFFGSCAAALTGESIAANATGATYKVSIAHAGNGDSVGSEFTTTIDCNEWHHILVTKSKSSPTEYTYRLYIDGVFSDQLVFTTSDNATPGNITTYNQDCPGSFDLALDNITYYSRVLSDVEILQLYNDVVAPDFTYYYDFENAPENPVSSITGGQPDFTIINPPTPLSDAFVIRT